MLISVLSTPPLLCIPWFPQYYFNILNNTPNITHITPLFYLNTLNSSWFDFQLLEGSKKYASWTLKYVEAQVKFLGEGLGEEMYKW